MILEKLRKVFNYIKHIKDSRMLLAFMHNGYLVETGWLKNFHTKNPVDINNNPIPWTTYSFIYFIKDFLKEDMVLFEFGSGNSTLFYASLVKNVYTVEHDQAWYNKLKQNLPENTTIYYRKINEDYEKCILEPKKKFDIIIVDGRRRNNCIASAMQCIKEKGIIVLDDSEREKYKDGIRYLQENGFKKIEFWGISHRYFHNKATTVFYKKL